MLFWETVWIALTFKGGELPHQSHLSSSKRPLIGLKAVSTSGPKVPVWINSTADYHQPPIPLPRNIRTLGSSRSYISHLRISAAAFSHRPSICNRHNRTIHGPFRVLPCLSIRKQGCAYIARMEGISSGWLITAPTGGQEKKSSL